MRMRTWIIASQGMTMIALKWKFDSIWIISNAIVWAKRGIETFTDMDREGCPCGAEIGNNVR